MLTKLALLFLAGMALMVMIFGRPKPGDSGWAARFRPSRLLRRGRPPDRVQSARPAATRRDRRGDDGGGGGGDAT